MVRAILQTDWMNRVAFDPQGRRDQIEAFFFKANDPRHDSAVWVRLTLFGNRTERYAEVSAYVFDAAGKHRAAKERLPIERVSIDPERGGVGIGEAVAEEGHTHGVVRGEGFAISWNLHFDDELGPYRHLPADWLYESSLTPQKLVSPHPCATVRGYVEIWDGLGPNSDLTKIEVDAWRGMQGHYWGSHHSERHAWSHCNAFEPHLPATFFEGFSASTHVAGMAREVSMARLVLDGTTYRFDGWRNLLGGQSESSPNHWRFALDGPDGHLEGELRGERENTLGVVYPDPQGPPRHCLSTALATLSLELTDRGGQRHSLRSSKATLEVVQNRTDHGIPMVL